MFPLMLQKIEIKIKSKTKKLNNVFMRKLFQNKTQIYKNIKHSIS